VIRSNGDYGYCRLCGYKLGVQNPHDVCDTCRYRRHKGVTKHAVLVGDHLNRATVLRVGMAAHQNVSNM